MAIEYGDDQDRLPSWILAFGPFLVIAMLVLLGFGAYSAFEFDWLAVTGTVEILLVLTGIGFIAGILPVAVGMMWFPYFRRLEPRWIHAVLAFSAGILVYIAIEMAAEAIGYASSSSAPVFGGAIVFVGVTGTIVLMELGSRWRKQKSDQMGQDGLRIAYLVAIGLGLHSVGEGLAIGTSFVAGDIGLVILFTIGFIIHNVTEGPAVISAVASERITPPYRHFAALGLLAGGGVIIGGWIGSFAFSPLVATAFFAIACGAIIQVTWEMFSLVQTETDDTINRRLVASFTVGIFLLFVLEEVIVEGWMGL